MSKISDFINHKFYAKKDDKVKKITVIDWEDVGYTDSWYEFKVRDSLGNCFWTHVIYRDKACKEEINAHFS